MVIGGKMFHPNWISKTPLHLAERTREIYPTRTRTGSFILYWMRQAQRAHDNPALDVAIEAANIHRMPLLVYHELLEKGWHHNARKHRFIIEGAAELHESLREKGIA